jgi:hypothetical protein
MSVRICFIILMVLTGCADAATPQIVAFLGSKGVGKDTAADYLVRSYGYQKYALADPMKKAVRTLFHFTDEQLGGNQKEIIDPYWGVTPREMMQFVGIDMLGIEMSKRFPQIGHTFAIRSFERWKNENPEALIVISDLRMQYDLDALKKMGALIIRIERPEIENDDQHSSENGVLKVTGYDLILINEGSIDDFENKIEEVLYSYGSIQ